MKQFLDEELNTWNITVLTKVPMYRARKEFNFRIKNIKKKGGEIISDPSLNSSKYIFSIKNDILGKNAYFNFKFSTDDISDVESFTFGFCDEMVKWLPNTLITCENEFLKIKNEEVLKVESTDVLSASDDSKNENNSTVVFNEILFSDTSDIGTVLSADESLINSVNIEEKMDLSEPILPVTIEKEQISNTKKKIKNTNSRKKTR